MRLFLSRATALFATVGIIPPLVVYTQTSHAKIEASYLISKYQKQVEGGENSAKNFSIDLFQVEVPLKSFKVGSELHENNITVDKFVQHFSSSPVFRIEKKIIQLAGLAAINHDIVLESYDIGDSMASLWTVIEKSNDEILFRWQHPTLNANGCTYFHIKEDIENEFITFQFGSGIEDKSMGIPDTNSLLGLPRILILHGHYFYARALLLNTIYSLKWKANYGHI